MRCFPNAITTETMAALLLQGPGDNSTSKDQRSFFTLLRAVIHGTATFCIPHDHDLIQRPRSAAASIAVYEARSASPACCTRIVAVVILFATSSASCTLARKLASFPTASSSGDPSSPIKNSAFAFSSAIKASGALEHPGSVEASAACSSSP